MSYPKLPDNSLLADTDWGLRAETSITLTDATLGTNTLFTVTGTVLVRLLAVCETTLTGAGATIEVGITGNTAKLIAQSTGTDLVANEIWHDASPDSGIELSSVLVENILANGQDIILTIGTAGLDTGKIKFMCFWYPLSSDGNVEGIKGGTYAAQIVSVSPSISPSISPSVSPSISPSTSPSVSLSPSLSPSISPSISPSVSS